MQTLDWCAGDSGALGHERRSFHLSVSTLLPHTHPRLYLDELTSEYP